MPERLHWRRGLLVGVLLIASLVLIASVAVLVVTGTDWGRERVRRIAQNAINGIVHGKATIGRLSGNLLTGMTVHDFAITDSSGAPFVAVESFSAEYSVMSLLRKRIWVDHAVLVRPLIVLDRPPNGTWNWQRIFPTDTTAKPPSQQNGWGDWLRFTNASVVNAQLIVRTPWSPSATLSPAARDSVLRAALGGGSRLMIRQTAGGYQKTVQLDSLTGTFPLFRLAEPGVPNKLLQVSSLSMSAFPFRAPGVVVRDVKGSFPFNNDSVWWKGAYVAMPQSKASGDGSYQFGSGDMTLAIHSDPANFADMRWIYPRLPAGQGTVDLRLRWRGSEQDYFAYNTDIRMGTAHATGSFGVTLGDTITVHDTDLRFAGLDTRTIEQLVPNFTSPRRGVLGGHATAKGGQHALAVDADVTFDDQQAGVSRVVALGEIGTVAGGGIRARDLRVQLLPVQVAMARTWMSTLPIAGVVTGSATVNGSTLTQLAVIAKLDHRDRGTRSVVDGKATVRLAKEKYFDVDLNARPASLVEVGRFFPTAGLQGSAAGLLHLTGTPSDLRVQADLRLSDGGRFTTHGSVDVASKEKGYDLTSTLYTVNARTITSKAPVTSLSAQVAVSGRGTAPATMRTTIAADLSTSRWDTVAVDTMSVRATVGDGLVNVQRLYAHGAHTAATVTGNFGLTRARSGELAYQVDVDSLGAFNRWLPKAAGPAAPVPLRPQARARAARRARADSARIARATELERMISGRPGPRLVINVPKPVPSDTIAGTLFAAGKLRGNLYDFDLRGRAGGENIVARGNFVRRFGSEYAWLHARTPKATLAVGLDADTLTAMGFAFDTLNLRATYATSGGHVELAVTQGDDRLYGARGDYTLSTDRKELRLAAMTFRLDTAYWSMPHPGLIQWGGPGLRITDFELRNRSNGRVYASGLLPTEGVVDFKVDVDNFPVSNIVDIVQTDIDAAGMVTVHGAMTGTLTAPTFRGTFDVVEGTYNGEVLPELHGRFGYADRQLVTHVDALRNGGQPMVTVDGRVPINLAFSGVTDSRLLSNPMSVDIVADSLPLELIPQFTDAVSNVHGRAAGKMSLRGTLKRPSLIGGFTLDRGTMKLAATGATFTNMGAAVRMANDTVYVDSIAGWAQGPIHVRGTVAVGDWREPAFNLFLVSNDAELLNGAAGKIRVDAGLALTGPFDSAYLSGAVKVAQGVLYAPETSGQHLINAGDPALFNVLDTLDAGDRELFPAASALLANLRVEMELSVNHNTWVRNREANVEIYTDDPVSIRMEQGALSLTGVVTTDRGEYSILSKRFQIKRGSAMFIGTADLNPTLQITGEYQVESAASRGTMNINVVIGGTLRKPKLALESDAQPPKTQSELLSLLAFGQSTGSLLSFSTSSVAGSGGSGDLFGASARLAATRLAGVAVGVGVDQLEVQAGRAFGTDVLDITPGDVPLFNGGNALTNFILQTRIEAGKYINGRTFVSLQEQSKLPGLSIEHRTADGWHFNASFEPRLLLREPTLNKQNYVPRTAIGGFIIREWRF